MWLCALCLPNLSIHLCIQSAAFLVHSYCTCWSDVMFPAVYRISRILLLNMAQVSTYFSSDFSVNFVLWEVTWACARSEIQEGIGWNTTQHCWENPFSECFKQNSIFAKNSGNWETLVVQLRKFSSYETYTHSGEEERWPFVLKDADAPSCFIHT